MVNEGEKAPNFTAKDSEGNTVSLSEYKGKKVVVYFYPKDDTPGCTREAIAFSEKIEQFKEKNTEILGVSKDSESSHQKFCQKHDLKIRLLADEKKEVIDAYGVWQEKKNYGKTYMGIVRSTYLIDENGTVLKIWKNVKVDGHVDAVLDSLS